MAIYYALANEEGVPYFWRDNNFRSREAAATYARHHYSKYKTANASCMLDDRIQIVKVMTACHGYIEKDNRRDPRS